MLKLGHQLAVEAAHGVASQEPRSRPGFQVGVDPLQVRQQVGLASVVLLHQHQLELPEHVLDDAGHLLVLDKQVVTSGNLHQGETT